MFANGAYVYAGQGEIVVVHADDGDVGAFDFDFCHLRYDTGGCRTE